MEFSWKTGQEAAKPRGQACSGTFCSVPGFPGHIPHQSLRPSVLTLSRVLAGVGPRAQNSCVESGSDRLLGGGWRQMHNLVVREQDHSLEKRPSAREAAKRISASPPGGPHEVSEPPCLPWLSSPLLSPALAAHQGHPTERGRTAPVTSAETSPDGKAGSQNDGTAQPPPPPPRPPTAGGDPGHDGAVPPAAQAPRARSPLTLVPLVDTVQPREPSTSAQAPLASPSLGGRHGGHRRKGPECGAKSLNPRPIPSTLSHAHTPRPPPHLLVP